MLSPAEELPDEKGNFSGNKKKKQYHQRKRIHEAAAIG
jgi:hypothetical protein